MSRVATGTTIAINIAAIAGLAVGGYYWLNHRLDEIVVDRLKPYTSFANGMLAAARGQYEDAFPAYEQAFRLWSTDVDKPGYRDALCTLCTSYLTALSYSETPEKHSAEFGRIIKLFDENRLSLDADQLVSIGWYYLRSGRIDPARNSFSKALNMYLADDDTDDAGHAFNGLYHVALGEGNADAALTNLQEAATRLPGSYNTFYKNTESPGYRRLCRLFPTSKATLVEVEKRLPYTYSVSEEIYDQDCDCEVSQPERVRKSTPKR